MSRIPDELIDQVQVGTDIAEVIARYVPLKRAGRHFKALCPFHKERTPSFVVNTDKQIFHCFGCGVGGNVFSFLMQHDRLTFPEAVRQLAPQAGVRLEEPTAGQSAASDLGPITEAACRYFERMLADAQGGRAAREYVTKRGVSPETAKRFRLGLSLPGWRSVADGLRPGGITVEQLERAGLVLPGRNGHYDRFRNRLIFPILDARSRVVGFGGRALDQQEPKYLNSPETPLYSKGRHLFGLAQAKDAVAERGLAIIVEGYFDCVVLAGAGIANVVSPLGTALTADQARLLKRYADQVVLAFDADAAGDAATLRGIDVLLETGVQVHVAKLPRGVDPDEVVQQQGTAAFQRLVDGAATVCDVLLEQAALRFAGDSMESRVRAARFLLPTLSRMSDRLLQREYVRHVAQRLRLDEAQLAREAQQGGERPGRLSASSAAVPAPRSAGRSAERLLVALILDEPARWAVAQDRLSEGAVTDAQLHALLQAVGEAQAAATPPLSTAQLVSRLTEEGFGALVAELMGLLDEHEAARDKAFEDCLRGLMKQARNREHLALVSQLEAAQAAGHEADIRTLVTQIRDRQKGAGANGESTGTETDQ